MWRTIIKIDLTSEFRSKRWEVGIERIGQLLRITNALPIVLDFLYAIISSFRGSELIYNSPGFARVIFICMKCVFILRFFGLLNFGIDWMTAAFKRLPVISIIRAWCLQCENVVLYNSYQAKYLTERNNSRFFVKEQLSDLLVCRSALTKAYDLIHLSKILKVSNDNGGVLIIFGFPHVSGLIMQNKKIILPENVSLNLS